MSLPRSLIYWINSFPTYHCSLVDSIGDLVSGLAVISIAESILGQSIPLVDVSNTNVGRIHCLLCHLADKYGRDTLPASLQQDNSAEAVIDSCSLQEESEKANSSIYGREMTDLLEFLYALASSDPQSTQVVQATVTASTSISSGSIPSTQSSQAVKTELDSFTTKKSVEHFITSTTLPTKKKEKTRIDEPRVDHVPHYLQSTYASKHAGVPLRRKKLVQQMIDQERAVRASSRSRSPKLSRSREKSNQKQGQEEEDGERVEVLEMASPDSSQPTVVSTSDFIAQTLRDGFSNSQEIPVKIDRSRDIIRSSFPLREVDKDHRDTYNQDRMVRQKQKEAIVSYIQETSDNNTSNTCKSTSRRRNDADKTMTTTQRIQHSPYVGHYSDENMSSNTQNIQPTSNGDDTTNGYAAGHSGIDSHTLHLLEEISPLAFDIKLSSIFRVPNRLELIEIGDWLKSVGVRATLPGDYDRLLGAGQPEESGRNNSPPRDKRNTGSTTHMAGRIAPGPVDNDVAAATHTGIYSYRQQEEHRLDRNEDEWRNGIALSELAAALRKTDSRKIVKSVVVTDNYGRTLVPRLMITGTETVVKNKIQAIRNIDLALRSIREHSSGTYKTLDVPADEVYSGHISIWSILKRIYDCSMQYDKYRHTRATRRARSVSRSRSRSVLRQGNGDNNNNDESDDKGRRHVRFVDHHLPTKGYGSDSEVLPPSAHTSSHIRNRRSRSASPTYHSVYGDPYDDPDTFLHPRPTAPHGTHTKAGKAKAVWDSSVQPSYIEFGSNSSAPYWHNRDRGRDITRGRTLERKHHTHKKYTTTKKSKSHSPTVEKEKRFKSTFPTFSGLYPPSRCDASKDNMFDAQGIGYRISHINKMEMEKCRQEARVHAQKVRQSNKLNSESEEYNKDFMSGSKYFEKVSKHILLNNKEGKKANPLLATTASALLKAEHLKKIQRAGRLAELGLNKLRILQDQSVNWIPPLGDPAEVAILRRSRVKHITGRQILQIKDWLHSLGLPVLDGEGGYSSWDAGKGMTIHSSTTPALPLQRDRLRNGHFLASLLYILEPETARHSHLNRLLHKGTANGVLTLKQAMENIDRVLWILKLRKCPPIPEHYFVRAEEMVQGRKSVIWGFLWEILQAYPFSNDWMEQQVQDRDSVIAKRKDTGSGDGKVGDTAISFSHLPTLPYTTAQKRKLDASLVHFLYSHEVIQPITRSNLTPTPVTGTTVIEVQQEGDGDVTSQGAIDEGAKKYASQGAYDTDTEPGTSKEEQGKKQAKLKKIHFPKQIVVPSTLAVLEAPIRDGTLLCGTVEKLLGLTVPYWNATPHTYQHCMSNLTKAVHTLKQLVPTRRMSDVFLFPQVEQEILRGNWEVVLGLWEDIRRCCDGVPPRNSTGNGLEPYYGPVDVMNPFNRDVDSSNINFRGNKVMGAFSTSVLGETDIHTNIMPSPLQFKEGRRGGMDGEVSRSNHVTMPANMDVNPTVWRQGVDLVPHPYPGDVDSIEGGGSDSIKSEVRFLDTGLPSASDMVDVTEQDWKNTTEGSAELGGFSSDPALRVVTDVQGEVQYSTSNGGKTIMPADTYPYDEAEKDEDMAVDTERVTVVGGEEEIEDWRFKKISRGRTRFMGGVTLSHSPAHSRSPSRSPPRGSGRPGAPQGEIPGAYSGILGVDRQPNHLSNLSSGTMRIQSQKVRMQVGSSVPRDPRIHDSRFKHGIYKNNSMSMMGRHTEMHRNKSSQGMVKLSLHKDVEGQTVPELIMAPKGEVQMPHIHRHESIGSLSSPSNDGDDGGSVSTGYVSQHSQHTMGSTSSGDRHWKYQMHLSPGYDLPHHPATIHKEGTTKGLMRGVVDETLDMDDGSDALGGGDVGAQQVHSHFSQGPPIVPVYSSSNKSSPDSFSAESDNTPRYPLTPQDKDAHSAGDMLGDTSGPLMIGQHQYIDNKGSNITRQKGGGGLGKTWQRVPGPGRGVTPVRRAGRTGFYDDAESVDESSPEYQHVVDKERGESSLPHRNQARGTRRSHYLAMPSSGYMNPSRSPPRRATSTGGSSPRSLTPPRPPNRWQAADMPPGATSGAIKARPLEATFTTSPARSLVTDLLTVSRSKQALQALKWVQSHGFLPLSRDVHRDLDDNIKGAGELLAERLADGVLLCKLVEKLEHVTIAGVQEGSGQRGLHAAAKLQNVKRALAMIGKRQTKIPLSSLMFAEEIVAGKSDVLVTLLLRLKKAYKPPSLYA